MMFGWAADDRRAAALWEAADRAFAIYRLYAEEMAARAIQVPRPDASEGTRDDTPPAGRPAE